VAPGSRPGGGRQRLITSASLARYQVAYEGDSEILDRDAWSYRVRVVMDEVDLGVWTGVVEGQVFASLPASTPQAAFLRLHRNGTLATADKIRLAAGQGELRSHWSGDVDLIPLGIEDLTSVPMSQGEGRDSWEAGELVLEFEV